MCSDVVRAGLGDELIMLAWDMSTDFFKNPASYTSLIGGPNHPGMSVFYRRNVNYIYFFKRTGRFTK